MKVFYSFMAKYKKYNTTYFNLIMRKTSIFFIIKNFFIKSFIINSLQKLINKTSVSKNIIKKEIFINIVVQNISFN
jgi:hypothetical protein